MCGIAGYVDFRTGITDPEILSRMAEALGRRGPDAFGTLVDGQCGLAHTRLSIIDLAGSRQPMRVSGSPVCLTYNGELYNYGELRRQLIARGIQLETAGDTEALLRWIDLDWHQTLHRFDGMFGFGAWHPKRDALLLARDPMGVKPLFYSTPRPGLLVFGSEIKALLRHPLVDAGLNEGSLQQALRFRAVYGTQTLYRGVRQLDPGCWLEFGRDGVRSGRYFDLFTHAAIERESQRQLTVDEIVTDGRERLEQAVRKRLIADVPVGTFLSGGLDSSLIAALMRQCRDPGDSVESFSVGFADDPHSELPFASQVAEALHTNHTEVRLLETDYRDLFLEMSECRDAPISEPADLAIARMSQVARRTVKVVLSGEGADEGFAGYPKYRFANVPAAARWLMRTIGPGRVAKFAGLAGIDSRRAAIAARSISMRGELERLAQWFSCFDRLTLCALLPGLNWSDEAWDATLDFQRSVLSECTSSSPMTRMQAVDCRTWLPGNLLERGDRMTMAYGLEMRVPFLDKRLVPFGLALSDRMKVRGRASKWIVREWAKQMLPTAIVNRKKWGFKVPLAEWFRGRLRPMLEDYLAASDGICGIYGDRKQISSLIQAHVNGEVDAHLELWTLLSAEVWFQGAFRRQSAPTRSATSLTPVDSDAQRANAQFS